jgi:epoxyqueuosine reductase
VPQRVEQGANQRRFARSQFAAQVNAHSRHEVGREEGAKALGSGLLWQLQSESVLAMMHGMNQTRSIDLSALALSIKAWGRELGFSALGIADVDLSLAQVRLQEWLAKGRHGEMDYMEKHGAKRAHPEDLRPGTLRVISARMNYWPTAADAQATLEDRGLAYISRYALGRDYHKVMRARLRQLAERIAAEVGGFGYRVFTDSAPVMEVELARKAGLGWRGKHTLLLARDTGSYFFLGEIFTDLALPVDAATGEHCGTCTRCIEICPTQAIVAPYELDARRCISYLTIELKGTIPVALRPLIGNRVYGCDDCQLVCPWNRFASASGEADFRVRNGLDRAELVELFAWDEARFRECLAGSAIARIGYERWLRNLAVGLGNAPRGEAVVAALRARVDHPSALVREHVQWALQRHAG